MLKKSEEEILNVGCGNGALDLILSESAKIYSLDINFSMLKGAKYLCNRICADGRLLPFRNKSFNYVISLDVLEHLPATDRKKFIHELLRVSNEKTIVTFSTVHKFNPNKIGILVFEKIYNIFKITFPDWYEEHNAQEMPQLTDVIKFVIDIDNNVKIMITPYQGLLGLLYLSIEGVLPNISKFFIGNLLYRFLHYIFYLILKVIDVPPYYSFCVIIEKINK
jgi:ubiquinone/menaquinone biosynthesis C-methylase UbiE